MVTTATARAAHFAAQAPLIASMASPARDPASCVYTKHTEPARSPNLSAWFGLMATVQEEAAHMEVDEARHAAGSASVDAAIPFGGDGGDGSRSLDGSGRRPTSRPRTPFPSTAPRRAVPWPARRESPVTPRIPCRLRVTVP